MSATVVRYRVKPGRAAENAELVRAVYEELATQQPAGFRYTTFVMDDELTFVHLALSEEGHEAPLPSLSAFQRFRADLHDRCDDAPEAMTLTTQVGSYGF